MQAGKYSLSVDRVINNTTGRAIPKSEPIFILRAQDKHALHALIVYMEACETPDQKEGVSRRVAEFCKYALEYDVKEPTP